MSFDEDNALALRKWLEHARRLTSVPPYGLTGSFEQPFVALTDLVKRYLELVAWCDINAPYFGSTVDDIDEHARHTANANQILHVLRTAVGL